MNRWPCDMAKIFQGVCLGLFLAVQCDVSAGADDASIVQPFVNEATLVVIKVDPAQLDLAGLAKLPQWSDAEDGNASERWVREITAWTATIRAATAGKPIYATVGIPTAPNAWPAFMFVEETPAADPIQIVDFARTLHEIHSFSRDGFTVLMPNNEPDVQAMLKELAPSRRETLPDAFSAVSEYPVQILILPPAHLRRTVAELMPQLPRQLGGGPSSVLTEGLVWAALGVDPKAPRIELQIQSSSEQAAHNLAKEAPKILLAIYDEMDDLQSRIPRDRLQTLLTLIKPHVEGDRIVIRCDELQAIGEGVRHLANAPAVLGEQVRRQTNMQRFKQILLAMHNYHDRYKMFPPRDEIRDANGKTGLSWRVHLLPFLDQGELYEQFALDEPWDSPRNKPLLAKMPKVFESPWLGIEPGHTTFLAPVGEDTILGREKATHIRMITDGTSNTIALVEVKPGESVPWTAPQDYNVDSQRPGRGLLVGTRGQFLAAFADGSARMIPGDAPGDVLLQLFQKSDGQPIEWEGIR